MVVLMRSYQLEDLYISHSLYAIFDNKMKPIKMCTNRFDDDTKNSFVELYTKVDSVALVLKTL